MNFEKIAQHLSSGYLNEEQTEQLAAFPEVAIQYAVTVLERENKTVTFGYVLGIVRNFLAKASKKKIPLPNARPVPPSNSPYTPYKHNEESPEERTARRIAAGHKAYWFETQRDHGDMTHNPEWKNLYASQKSELFRLFPYLREVHHRDFHILGLEIGNPSLPSVQEAL